jgi:hypothetical protein
MEREPISHAEFSRFVEEARQMRIERDDARRWAVRLEQLMFAERDAAYKLLTRAVSGRPIFSDPPNSEPI